jgi:hypothetical protein
MQAFKENSTTSDAGADRGPGLSQTDDILHSGSGEKSNSDLLAYDKSILDMVRHIEDVLLKFSLQNYIAAGGVIIAFYTTKKMPMIFAVGAVIAVCSIFTVAILSNLPRYALLWRLHCIVRDNWLTTQPELSNSISSDPIIKKYLDNKDLPMGTVMLIIVVNLLPAVAGPLAFYYIYPN